MAKTYKLTAGAVRKTADAVQWVSAQARSAPLGNAAPMAGQSVFYAKITAKTAINGLIRWKYTIELGYWNFGSSPTTGGAWVATSSGTIYAFNSAEDMNTAGSGSTTIGTGNTVAQSTGVVNGGTCVLLPLPVGCFVAVIYRGYDPATKQSYYTILNFANSAQ